MDKICIITTTGKVKEMYSSEAKSKGYLSSDSSDRVPGYEIMFNDNSALWLSVLEFNTLATFHKKGGSYIQECPDWADNELKEMFLEYKNLKEKIIEIKNLLDEKKFNLNDFIIEDVLKLQYNFMLGYINCLGDRINHYCATNSPDMPTLEGTTN